MEKENFSNIFFGPITIDEIRAKLAVDQPKVDRRATIGVSQPSRTIYDECPTTDLLLRMQLFEQSDDELDPSFVEEYFKDLLCKPLSANYEHASSSTSSKTTNFIKQALEVLSLSDCDDVKLGDDSGAKTDDTFDDSVVFISEELPCEGGDYKYVTKVKQEDVSYEDEVINISSPSYVREDEHNDSESIKYSSEDSATTNHAQVDNGIKNMAEVNSSENEEDDRQDFFNDTLEEIERALKYGLDYSELTSVNAGDNSENIVLIEDQCKSEHAEVCLPPKPISRIPIHIQKTPEFSFKQPLVKVTSEKHKGSNFKNIPSPVGIYIKNSPRVPLIKNITSPKPLSKKLIFDGQETPNVRSNKENVLPDVIYKPPRQILKTTAQPLKLPANVQRHLPQPPNVIKHQGRIAKKDETHIGEKLLGEDLSMCNLSNFNSTVPLEEISVLNCKEAYIA